MIRYSTLAQSPLQEAITMIRNTSRIRFGDITLTDLLLVGSIQELKLSDHLKPLCYGMGVYVFFDGEAPRYVGKADNFLHRLTSHRVTDPRPNWGWNALLQLVSTKLLEVSGHPTVKDLHKALTRVEDFGVVRVVVDSAKVGDKLIRLERVIMKGMKNQCGTILNGRVGKLSAKELARPVCDLL